MVQPYRLQDLPNKDLKGRKLKFKFAYCLAAWASKRICMLGNIYIKDGSYSFHNLQTLFDILLFFFI